MNQRVEDLLLLNGKVLTLDRRDSVHEAVLCRGGRVLVLGSTRDLRRLCAKDAQVVDLGGRTVIPGLVDVHAHLDREGLKQLLPSLAGATSVDDILDRIAQLVRRTPPGEWIVTMPVGDPPHYRNVPGCLREGRFPTRWELDAVAPANPVYIRPAWGYWPAEPPLTSVANSMALAQAGVTRDSVSPVPSVEIERDPATGEPTGIFREWTMIPTVEHTIMGAVPAFDHDDRVTGLRASMTHYLGTGTTSVFEGHGVAEEVRRAYADLCEERAMTVRAHLTVSPSWGVEPDPDLSRAFGAGSDHLGYPGSGDRWLRTAGLFVEPDRTEEAMVRARSARSTGWGGMAHDSGIPRDRVIDFLREAARHRLRVAMLGSEALRVLAEVDRIVPLRGLRWVVGHISVLSETDIRRARAMGLVLTMHTSAFIENRGAQLRDSLPPDQEERIVPLRTLLEHGVRFGLGTDNIPTSLFRSIWHCVVRPDRHGGPQVASGQCLTRLEALRAATLGAAYVDHSEQQKGTLESGKYADLAVLSSDPLTSDADALPAIRSELTVVEGRVVHWEAGWA